MVTGTVSKTRQSVDKAIAEQDRSKMPDKTESAVDSAVSGLEQITEINLIRGFKTAKRVSAPRLRAAGLHSMM
jgi:hypothetical protein